jgi:hypothetical protein
MKEKEEKNHAKDQARAQLKSIMEMVANLNTDDDDQREEAIQRIQEDALSVEIRSGWTVPGSKMEAEEFRILLCTGGPAVRIIGELNEYHEPTNTRIEHQDWGTPWTDYPLDIDEEEAVVEYSRQFYFEI